MSEPPSDRPLTVPLLLGRSFDHPLIAVPLILGSLALALTTVSRTPAERSAALLVGGSLVLSGLLALAVVGLRRRWLQVMLQGIALRQGGKTEVVTDEQVKRIWRRGQEILLDYQGKAGPRHLRLSCRAEPEATELDPLGPLWARLVGVLVERGEFSGDGWALDVDGLKVTRRRRVEQTAWDDLAEARLIEGELCVWRSGDVRPWLILPRESPNVVPLHRLLRERLPHTPAPPEVHPLGRWLFARQDCWLHGKSTWLGGLLSVVFALPLLLWLLVRRLRGRPTLHVHERGVVLTRPRGSQSLAYEEIDGLVWAPDGTVAFHPAGDRRQPALIHHDAGPYNSPVMLELLVSLAGCLAERWRDEIQAGREVAWTERLRFLRSGVEVMPEPPAEGLPGVLPYLFLRWFLADGGVWLGYKHTRVFVSPETLNFHAGLLVLDRLCRESQGLPALEGGGIFPPLPADERIFASSPFLGRGQRSLGRPEREEQE